MRKLRITPLTVMLFAMTATGFAAPRSQSAEQFPSAISSVHDTAYIKSGELLMMVSNNGSFAYDQAAHFGKNDGLHYPGHCPTSVIYAAGLWIGAKVEGEIRVSTAEYSFDYTPGTMTGSLPTPDGPQFRVYKIRAGDSRLTNLDYAEWPFDDGAPALKNHDGSDSIDAEGYRIPLQLGDEAVWTVFNDAGFSAHYSDPGSGSTGPLGIESQLYAYAYDSTGDLGRIIFMQYKLINKSGNTLDSTHVAFWADPDIGDPGDDYVGCDTLLDLGYGYNADSDDPQYGASPPAVGFGILNGPVAPSPGEIAWIPSKNLWVKDNRNLPMTSFSRYINGTDPAISAHTWNFMRGRNRDGAIVINPTTGSATKFWVSGDPLNGTGWLDSNPADRRYMATSGPFTMLPGDTQEVVISVLAGSSFPFNCEVSMFVDTVHAIHIAGTGGGSAYALIMKPDSTTGHDYQVTFTGSPEDLRWHLSDLTLGQVVAADQSNIADTGVHPYVDGILVKVVGYPPGVGGWEIPSGTRQFTWAGLSYLALEGFNGVIGWNSPCHLFAVCENQGVPSSRLRRVLLKLAPTDATGNFDSNEPDVSYAYRYLRGSSLPAARPEFTPFITDPSSNYQFQSFAKSVPLSAWDIDAIPPRRLVVGHLENNVSGGAVDGKYWPPVYNQADNWAGSGPREWLFIFDVEYSESLDPGLRGSAVFEDMPIMYMSTAARRFDEGWAAGDEFLIIPVDSNLFFSEADTFSFTAPLPGSAMAGTQGSMDNLTSIADLRHLDSVAHAKFEETHWTCACPCFADPGCAGNEAPVVNVLDIVGFIDVAFRAVPAVHDRPCPSERTDVDCTGSTDIVDVVKAIDVAFRDSDPAVLFCNPCNQP